MDRLRGRILWTNSRSARKFASFSLIERRINQRRERGEHGIAFRRWLSHHRTQQSSETLSGDQKRTFRLELLRLELLRSESAISELETRSAADRIQKLPEAINCQPLGVA